MRLYFNHKHNLKKTFILSTTPRIDLYEQFKPFSSVQEFLSYSNTGSGSSSSISHKTTEANFKQDGTYNMNTIPRINLKVSTTTPSHKRRNSSPNDNNNSDNKIITSSTIPPTSPTKCYAGGAFHNSPAPDTLPIPEFVSKVTEHQQTQLNSDTTLISKLSVLEKPNSYSSNITPPRSPNTQQISNNKHHSKIRSSPKQKPIKILPPENNNYNHHYHQYQKIGRIHSKNISLSKPDVISTINNTELLSNDLKKMLNIGVPKEPVLA